MLRDADSRLCVVGWREAATLGSVGMLELAPTFLRGGGDSLSRSGMSADSWIWVSLSPLNCISADNTWGLLGGPEEGGSMPRGMGPSCPLNIDSADAGGMSASL